MSIPALLHSVPMRALGTFRPASTPVLASSAGPVRRQGPRCGERDLRGNFITSSPRIYPRTRAAGCPWSGIRPLQHSEAARCRASADDDVASAPTTGTPSRLRDLAYLSLISFCAAQNRSLLGQRAFVETVLAAHREGYEPRELQMTLQFMQLENGGKKFVSEQDMDAFALWLSLVSLTLRETGVQVDSAEDEGRAQMSEGGEDPSVDRYMLGMLQFVKGMVNQIQEGGSLRQLRMQQQAALDPMMEAGQEVPPTMMMMQQNSMLVYVTWEVVNALGLGTTPLGSPEVDSEDVPEGMPPMITEALHFADGPSNWETNGPVTARRACIAFCGAAADFVVAANAFGQFAMGAYFAGITADELLQMMAPMELWGESSPLISTGTGKAAQVMANAESNAELAARWVSVLFLSWAQLGAPHPAADCMEGWAVAGSINRDAIAAVGLAEFVGNTLRKEVEALDTPDGVGLRVVSARKLSDLIEGEDGVPVTEEQWDELQQAREMTLLESTGGQVVLEGEEYAKVQETSPGLRIFQQQIAIVQLACAVLRHALQTAPKIEDDA